MATTGSAGSDGSASSNWPPRALILALGGALVLRLGVALVMKPSFGDQEEYVAGAERLLSGQPLPILNNMVFVRSPGYSLLIAAIWAIVPGRTFVAIRVVQALLSTASCFLIYRLALKVRDDSRTALAAALVAAFYPYFLFEVATVGSECLFMFLVLLGTYFFARSLGEEGIRWKDFSVGVIAYGAGILVRPNLGPIEALFGLLLAWRYRKRVRTVLAAGAIMIIGTLLVIGPWSLAVQRQGLGLVLSSDGGGAWYYVGHCDFAVQVYCGGGTPKDRSAIVRSSWELDPVLFVSHTLPRSEQARLFWRTALKWDAEHLSAQPCLAAGKLWSYWRPWVNPDAYTWKLVAVSMVSLPLLLLGLLGLWKFRTNGGSGLAICVAANVVGGSLTAMVYSAEIRYRIPAIDPLLIPYAASAAAAFLDVARTRLRTRRLKTV
jgi:4-amino-4-deoxy-L-arabinose transferase-like glycosyltransferase